MVVLWSRGRALASGRICFADAVSRAIATAQSEDAMEQINARSIFSPATGFIQRGGFDWTCNPYLGCSFGCTYCYAMFLPQNRRPKEHWGRWFQAKANAVELARKQAPKVAGQAVYMSSVTEPELPAE